MTFRTFSLAAIAAIAVTATSVSAQYRSGVPISRGPSNLAIPSYGYAQPSYSYGLSSNTYSSARPSNSYNYAQPSYNSGFVQPTYGLVAPLHGSSYGLNLGQAYNSNAALYPQRSTYSNFSNFGNYNNYSTYGNYYGGRTSGVPYSSFYRGGTGQFGPYRWR